MVGYIWGVDSFREKTCIKLKVHYLPIQADHPITWEDKNLTASGLINPRNWTMLVSIFLRQCCSVYRRTCLKASSTTFRNLMITTNGRDWRGVTRAKIGFCCCYPVCCCPFSTNGMVLDASCILNSWMSWSKREDTGIKRWDKSSCAFIGRWSDTPWKWSLDSWWKGKCCRENRLLNSETNETKDLASSDITRYQWLKPTWSISWWKL